ncbi:Kelch-like protein 3 [Clonorchis sinensis]|uniref:Kelch-like protein 2 n=2 Tax=Clonorchis sinensis TaxID=79923 RepID=H2KR49_CLOSI|nr:Kelch-like protein 3 [Clonorchis sinensis]GAA31368.1 kelch-like protein 2 [Clonorchis sinensis]
MTLAPDLTGSDSERSFAPVIRFPKKSESQTETTEPACDNSPSPSFSVGEDHRMQLCDGHHQRLLATMNELRQTGRFCDVTLQAGSTKISAHKAVLASSSQYFNAMFSHPMREMDSSCITIGEVDEATLVRLMDFFYTGLIQVNVGNVQNLLQAANLLQLSPVKDACCSFVTTQLHPENCLGILRFARWHDCAALADASYQFAVERFVNVSTGKAFLTLGADEVEQLISSDRLIAPEDRVFEAVRHWVEHKFEERKQFAGRLFDQVRFGLLSRELVLQLSKSADFLVQNPWCKEHLFQTLVCRLSSSDGNSSTHPTVFRCHYSSSKVLLVPGGWNEGTLRSVEYFDFCNGRWMSGATTSVGRSETQTHNYSGIPDLEVARQRYGMAVVRSRVYVIGGVIEDKPTRTVTIFITAENRWTSGPELHFKRDRVSVAALNTKIYAMGGDCGDDLHDSVEVLDVTSGTWNIIAPMLCPRRNAGAATLNNKIYVVGGENTTHFLSSVECYDPATKSWALIASMCFPRHGPAVCALNNRLYAVGGVVNAGSGRTAECYSPKTGNWKRIADLNGFRSGAGLAAHNGRLYLVGGWNFKGNLNSTESYDPEEDTWTVAPSRMRLGRSYIGAAVVSLYRFG